MNRAETEPGEWSPGRSDGDYEEIAEEILTGITKPLTHAQIIEKIGQPGRLDLTWDVAFTAENSSNNRARNLLLNTDTPSLPPHIALPGEKSVKRIDQEFPHWLIRGVYDMIPAPIRSVSNLCRINHYNCVVLPDETGNGKAISWQTFETSEEMQRRKDFFIGQTDFDGTGIGLIPMPPPCVSSLDTEKALEATRLYHIHVFLHEFFHTLINVVSDNGTSLESDPAKISAQLAKKRIGLGERDFSLGEWYREYIATCIVPFLGRAEGLWIPSHYASSYSEALCDPSHAKFTEAVAEHMCETFVAYMLDTVPNTDGWLSFRSECSDEPAYHMIHKLCDKADNNSLSLVGITADLVSEAVGQQETGESINIFKRRRTVYQEEIKKRYDRLLTGQKNASYISCEWTSYRFQERLLRFGRVIRFFGLDYADTRELELFVHLSLKEDFIKRHEGEQ